MEEVLDGEVPPKYKNSDPNKASQEPSRSGNPEQRKDQKQEEIKIKKNHLLAMLGEGVKQVEKTKQLGKVEEVLEVLDRENPPNKKHDLDKLCQEPSSIAKPELGEDQKQEEIKTKKDPLLLLLREGERKQKQVEKQKQEEKQNRTPGRRKKEEESGATKKMKNLLENWRKQTPDSRTKKEKIQV